MRYQSLYEHHVCHQSGLPPVCGSEFIDVQGFLRRGILRSQRGLQRRYLCQQLRHELFNASGVRHGDSEVRRQPMLDEQQEVPCQPVLRRIHRRMWSVPL